MFLFRDGLFTPIYFKFDGSGQVLFLPPYYAEIIKSYRMTHGVTMVINGGGGLQMVFEHILMFLGHINTKTAMLLAIYYLG